MTFKQLKQPMCTKVLIHVITKDDTVIKTSTLFGENQNSVIQYYSRYPQFSRYDYFDNYVEPYES